jgi:hypothetical protein
MPYKRGQWGVLIGGSVQNIENFQNLNFFHIKTKLIIFEINYKRFTDIPKSDLSPQSTENG